MSGKSSDQDVIELASGNEESSAHFQCSICNVRYNRIDHLVRHVRTHTNHRPYKCKICSKTFGRQDLMKRHELAHGNEGAADMAPPPKKPNRTGERVPAACKLCSSKKLKCSGERPCQRCRSKDAPCVYGRHVERLHELNTGDTEKAADRNNELIADVDAIRVEDTMSCDMPMLNDIPDVSSAAFLSQEGNTLSGFNLFSNPLDFPTILGGEQLSPGQAWELNPTDFAFLDGMNNRWILEPPRRTGLNEQPVFAMGSTAFQKSSATRLWEPESYENCELERRNLALSDTYHTPPQPIAQGAATFIDFMSTANRDRVLQMILAVSSQSAAATLLSSFPSSETLTNLILNYVTTKRIRQVGDFLHLPTFDLNKQRPELIGALVAMGAVETASSAVRKFGYALQEVIRLTILRLFEEDNSAFRDVGICQAFFLQQHIAFFSGLRRKTDLAEGCSMAGDVLLSSLQTMLRKAEIAAGAIPQNDEESILRVWKDWASRESMRRLIYFVYNLDAHISMARSRPAHYSYNRMTVQLPSVGVLWQAADARSWRALNAELDPFELPSPSLRALLQDPAQLVLYEKRIDLNYARACILSGLWVMIWECRQMHQLTRASTTWNQFLLDSRIAELYSALQLCSTDSIRGSTPQPDLDILQHALSMHLHVSFQDLVAFAGEDTESERTESLSYAESWIDTKACRIALWHAGQAIRSAADFSSHTVDDIYVTCLFQAAVVMWTYGVFVKPKHSAQNDVDHGEAFILNGRDVEERSRMPIRSQGKPSLVDAHDRITALNNPAATMDHVASVLQLNWRESLMPRYCEEITRLLLDLGHVVR